MSAYEEMRANGEVGKETVELFVWTVSSVTRRHRYPPPAGSQNWTHDACLEWVLELFNKKGHDLAVRLFALAVDQDSLARLIYRTVENELKDQAKATTPGKLRGRMRTLLTKADGFVDATSLFGGDPAWTLEGFGDSIFVGDWEDLLLAPELKRIEPIRALNTAGPTSRENADKLVTAARIVLRAAGGAIRDQVLATALVKLFELDTPEVFFGIDENAPSATARPSDTPDGRAEAVEAGDRLIMELSTDELRGLVVLDQPDSVAAAHLPQIADVGPFMERLRIKMQELIGPEGVPPGALEHVLDRARKLPDPP